jgi:hypothetical protein
MCNDFSKWIQTKADAQTAQSGRQPRFEGWRNILVTVNASVSVVPHLPQA